MHISSATLLLLIPATLAVTIPVINTVSGIAETAVVVTNPSIVSRENTHFSRDVGKTADGVQVRGDILKSAKEPACSLTDPNNIPGRSSDICVILDDLNNFKEELKNSLEEVSEKVGEQIKGITDQLNYVLEHLLQRIVEILNEGSDGVIRRDVGKTAEEIQLLA
ncbi:hypothetical protein VE03_08030 [Pseudogymnoascus sp. 23342-1-I1]|nr:hypothetical protein VE03_08030 [Pseudogymnoascus sp. 23342-1-I1]